MRAALLAIFAAGCIAVGGGFSPAVAKACDPDALTALKGVRVESAREATAQDRLIGALPAHCIVRGVIDPRTGAGGVVFGTGFELRLPANWNRRFLFQGGGGLDGAVLSAVGPMPVRGARGRPSALARGYAVVSIDGGHKGTGATFAADRRAWMDFAYASIPRASRVAKAMTQDFYGSPIAHSYFMGCSNGGREAMMAAQLDPTAFDGVVAGDPGFNLAFSALEEVWATSVLNDAAPRGADGRPILSRALSDEALKLVADAALKQCDGDDGLVDGMIFTHCRFDPTTVLCAPEDAGQGCLSAAKVDVIRRIFGGARTRSGAALYADWPYDPGIAGPAWRMQKLGTSPTGRASAGNATRGVESLYDFFLKRPAPDPLPPPDEVAALAASLQAPARLVNAQATDLRPFAQRGGKLLLFQGMSDPVFSANDLIAWHRGAVRDTGEQWSRLVLVPGMGHCGGGPALDNFDPLAAIEAWVEDGMAPAALEATGEGFPGVSRPLCAWPNVATYDGAGDRNRATSFRCAAPRQTHERS